MSVNAALEILAQLLLDVARNSIFVEALGMLQKGNKVIAYHLEEQSLLRTMLGILTTCLSGACHGKRLRKTRAKANFLSYRVVFAARSPGSPWRKVTKGQIDKRRGVPKIQIEDYLSCHETPLALEIAQYELTNAKTPHLKKAGRS